MKVFMSYHFDPERLEDEDFVHRVSCHLRKQPGVEPYCYTEERRRSDWPQLVGQALAACDRLVLFVRAQLGNVQPQELKAFRTRWPGQNPAERELLVLLGEDGSIPAAARMGASSCGLRRRGSSCRC